MSAVPASMLLVELDLPPTGRAPKADRASDRCGVASCRRQEAIAADIEAAYARGLSEGRVLAGELAIAEQAAVADRQAREFADKTEKAAAYIAAHFDRQIDAMHLGVCQTMSRLLQPMLASWIRADAIETLSARLGAILEDKVGLNVRVEGPQELVAALAPVLSAAGKGHSVSIRHSAATDVRVTIDQLLLETQIGSWLQAIEASR
jgi:hypothetical protein